MTRASLVEPILVLVFVCADRDCLIVVAAICSVPIVVVVVAVLLPLLHVTVLHVGLQVLCH